MLKKKINYKNIISITNNVKCVFQTRTNLERSGLAGLAGTVPSRGWRFQTQDKGKYLRAGENVVPSNNHESFRPKDTVPNTGSVDQAYGKTRLAITENSTEILKST